MSLNSNCIISEPKLTPVVSQRSLPEGSRFALLCNVEYGSAPLFFQWLKDGHVIVSNSDTNYKIETSDKHSTLAIENVHRSDAANYSCIARNAVGSDMQSILISIKGVTQSV